MFINMKVTELGDCTIVIEKEDIDDNDFSIGKMFKDKTSPKVSVFIPDYTFGLYRAKEYIFNDDVLIVYLDAIPEEIKTGAHIGVKVGRDWYETNYQKSLKM
jgi:hypothetical protein